MISLPQHQHADLQEIDGAVEQAFVDAGEPADSTGLNFSSFLKLLDADAAAHAPVAVGVATGATEAPPGSTEPAHLIEKYASLRVSHGESPHTSMTRNALPLSQMLPGAVFDTLVRVTGGGGGGDGASGIWSRRSSFSAPRAGSPSMGVAAAAAARRVSFSSPLSAARSRAASGLGGAASGGNGSGAHAAMAAFGSALARSGRSRHLACASSMAPHRGPSTSGELTPEDAGGAGAAGGVGGGFGRGGAGSAAVGGDADGDAEGESDDLFKASMSRRQAGTAVKAGAGLGGALHVRPSTDERY
jgi:hypothetical protein